MKYVSFYFTIYQIITQNVKLFQVEFYEVSVERRWFHRVSYSFTSRMGIKIVRNRKQITKSHYCDWSLSGSLSMIFQYLVKFFNISLASFAGIIACCVRTFTVIIRPLHSHIVEERVAPFTVLM